MIEGTSSTNDTTMATTTSDAINEENPTAKATTNKAIANASSRYPTRLASDVHRATCWRRARTGSKVGSCVAIQWPTMVRVERRGEAGRVALVTLDRPARRNALDVDALEALHAAQGRIDDARSVVLTGAPPAFCAGADLDAVEDARFAGLLARVLTGFTTMRQPVVAAVDGPALGAGTQLAIACDLRVATPTSRFGIPAARLGLVVDHWTVRRLQAELGSATARAMLLAAETFDAVRLHALGVVHRLGDLDDAVAWADELAELAPLTIAAHKVALERAAGHADAPDETVEQARAAAWSSADAVEGRAAFQEKRPPRFVGA
jgi:enoyl-CoA hydratase